MKEYKVIPDFYEKPVAKLTIDIALTKEEYIQIANDFLKQHNFASRINSNNSFIRANKEIVYFINEGNIKEIYLWKEFRDFKIVEK